MFFLLHNATHFRKPQVTSQGGATALQPLEGLDPPLKRSIAGTLAARSKGSPLTIDPVRLILLDDTDYELEEGGLRIHPEQADGEDRAK